MANNWNQSSTGNPDPRLVQDPDVNPFERRVAAPSDAELMRGQRRQLQGLAYGASGEARAKVNKIVQSLDTIGDVDRSHSYIRAQANAKGGSGRANAAQALQAQRDIIDQATADAKSAFSDLRPLLLAAVARIPQGATESQINQRREDLIAALEAAGKSGANLKAQQLLTQALQAKDAVMAYVICSPDVMGYRAPALGYRLDVLQNKYAQAMIAEYGLRPLANSQQIPGAELLTQLDFVKECIDAHNAGATAALNALAAECNL